MTASRLKKQYFAGAALLAAAAVFVLLVFVLLSRTDTIELWLSPTAEDDMGWRWEVWQGGQPETVEPDFPDLYTACLPAQAALAVRGRTVLPEFGDFVRLSVASYGSGVELFLDGELLYSDFQSDTRGAEGFLQLSDAQRAALAANERRVQVDLPEDYAGRELTLVRYFPGPQTDPQPVCPVLCSDETVYAVMVTSDVTSILMAGLWALLALTVIAVFILDIPNGSPDWRSLLLALYFLMLFVDAADASAAGGVSLLPKYLGPTFLANLYAAPLQLYLATLFTGWRRWFLCAATLLWAGIESWQMYASVRAGDILVHLPGDGRYTLWLVLVTAVVFAAEVLQRRRRSVRSGVPAAAIWLSLGAFRILYGSLEFDGNLPAYLHELGMSFAPGGNCLPLLSVLMDTTAATATVLLVTGVVHRTVMAQRTVEVLRERARQTRAGYERMLKAEEATNAANHEMRHHMTALAGLLQQGDTQRAQEYIAAVADTLDRLPAMRYSPNILVNAVAGAYLDAARAQGIRVECSLQVPAELPVADGDLSVFLTNLLENALHACQKLGAGQARFIRLKMALHENFLFISCANSAPDEQEEAVLDEEQRAARKHGYGLAAMSQIAEKYSSMLVTEQQDGVFTVKSNFSLKTPVKA